MKQKPTTRTLPHVLAGWVKEYTKLRNQGDDLAKCLHNCHESLKLNMPRAILTIEAGHALRKWKQMRGL